MKKTLTSLALLASMSTGTQQANEVLFNVSQEIHQEVNALISQKKDSTKDKFEKLAELSQQIQSLNQWVKEHENLDKTDLSALSVVNSVLDFTFVHFKNKYEKVIYAHYTQEFRLFSSVRSTFKSLLKEQYDRLNGIEIVSLKGLELSAQDLANIQQQAKILEGKIINVCSI